MKKKALIIDDEPDILELLGITLRKMGIEVVTAKTFADALVCLQQGRFDLCLSDMKLPDGNGFDLVKHIQECHPELPVAIITAHGNVDLAVEALKLGAFDFISKPVELEKLRDIISAALKLDSAKDVSPGSGLIGQSDLIKNLKQQISKVTRNQAPVFISGESGSGKELAARAIHCSGPRSNGPFVPVNCGAIPDDLMESEFFGHIKGSFTGATVNKQGLFQAANTGTLFLDEVADLPLHMQVKLLRAIQERAVKPVGANTEIPVDIRILSATHKNLQEEVRAKRFREDLYYRINVIQIDVPPLRERPGDIEPLAKHILERLARELDTAPPAIGREALQKLKTYGFPGNVRELENIIERAFTLCDGKTIEGHYVNLPAVSGLATDTANEKSSLNHSIEGFDSIDHYLEEIEKEILMKTLEEARWNKTAAARQLGISFRQIRYKLKKLGLDD